MYVTLERDTTQVWLLKLIGSMFTFYRQHVSSTPEANRRGWFWIYQCKLCGCKFSTISPVFSGRSRFFESGVQVQADYSNSTDCFIVARKYVYAEASKSVPIRVKHGKFLDLRSHLLAFQAPYSEHWSGSHQNCRICSTAPVGLIASFCSWLVKLTITSQWPCRQISPHFISIWTCLQTIEQNSCTNLCA